MFVPTKGEQLRGKADGDDARRSRKVLRTSRNALRNHRTRRIAHARFMAAVSRARVLRSFLPLLFSSSVIRKNGLDVGFLNTWQGTEYAVTINWILSRNFSKLSSWKFYNNSALNVKALRAAKYFIMSHGYNMHENYMICKRLDESL